MRRLNALLALTALAAGSAVLGTAAPAAATADASIPLGIDGFRDITTDASHVFITAGGSNGILVRDLEGAAVTTITNEPGAAQMALSDDGSRLFVALANGDAVAAIDTSTLAEVARYSTGASTCPSTVAVVGHRVWYGYGCNGGSGNAGVIDLSAGTPTAAGSQFPAGTFYSAPLLAASPALADRLITSDSAMTLWDVSGATPTSVAATSSGVGDMAITSDGSHVITATGYPYDHPSYKTTDLSADGVYGSNNSYPNGVATSSNGLVAAGINDSYGKDVNIYRTDGTLVRGYDFGGCCNQGDATSLQGRGVAFDSTGSRLYAVVADYLGNVTTLKVLHAPGAFPTGLALTAPSGATYNKPFAVKGKLVSTDLPAGQTLTVTRDLSGKTVTRPSVTTAADGSFTITDTIAGRGAVGYTATFAGDATHATASKRVVVNVSGVTPSLAITTSSGPYAYGAKPVVVAHLGATRSRTVSLYAQQYGGTRRLLKTGTVDSHGDLRVAYTMTRRTTFTASFPGDSLYNPRAVAKALLSKAALSSRMAGQYGTSGAYALFHASTNPLTPVAVSPNNGGACVSFVVQRLVSGTWRTAVTNGCVNLESNSQTVGEFYGTHVAGTSYRLMVTFNGTTLNARTPGPWLYFRFTR